MESLVAYRIAQTVLRTRTSKDCRKGEDVIQKVLRRREKEERRKAAGLWWAHGRTEEGRDKPLSGGGSPRPAAARFAR
eukprot:3513998-Pleurochrysis_carterae.AAC.1